MRVFIIMTQIGYNAGYAFDNGANFNQANTMVSGGSMFLHGNEIAKHDQNGDILISLAGWNTHTTKERLNNISGVRVQNKNFEPFLNGKPIGNHGWYKV